MLIKCFFIKAGAKLLIFNEKITPAFNKAGAIYVYLTFIRSLTSGILHLSDFELTCRV